MYRRPFSGHSALSKKVKCLSGKCQGSKRNALPSDSALVFATKLPESMSSDWERGLRRKNDCAHLASNVEIWCRYCKEDTVVNGDIKRSTIIDGNPRWTIGSRPKYVPRPSTCKNCAFNKNKQFVPVDPQLPFIPRRNLDRIVNRFSRTDLEFLSRVLDAQESASHTPRLLKRKREQNGQSLIKSKLARQLRVEDPTKPKIVYLKCEKCGEPCGQNVCPKWHVDTGEYIALKRPHCPVFCTTRTVWLIPRSNIPWIRSTKVEWQQRCEAKEIAAKPP